MRLTTGKIVIRGNAKRTCFSQNSGKDDILYGRQRSRKHISLNVGLHTDNTYTKEVNVQQKKDRAPEKPLIVFARPLPRVLILHTGGTLGMIPEESFESSVEGQTHLKHGTGGTYAKQRALKPGATTNDGRKQEVVQSRQYHRIDASPPVLMAAQTLHAGNMLNRLLSIVPELRTFGELEFLVKRSSHLSLMIC